MTKQKCVTALWSLAISFALSFGSCACLVTGFSMSVSLWLLAGWCFAGSAIFSICFVLPLGALPAGLLALAAGFLWRDGSLELSIQALCYRISRIYHQAYGWPILKLNMYTADDMEPMLALGIYVLGLVAAWVTTWTVCRKKPAVFAVLLSVLPLLACLLVTDTVPAVGCLYCYLAATALLLLSQTSRRRDIAQGNRICTWAVVPVLAALLVLFVAAPRETYMGQAQAQKLADAFLQAKPVKFVIELFNPKAALDGVVETERVNLTDVGLRLESQAEMMTVKANYTGTLYLRGRSFDTYDGWYWSSTQSDDFYWPDNAALRDIGEVEISTKYAHMMLYLPYYPQSVSLRDMPEGMLNSKKLTEYSFACKVAPTDLSEYQNRAVYEITDRAQILSVLTEHTRRWADSVFRDNPELQQDSVYLQAQAVARFVSKSARYDKETPKMPRENGDFARWFMEESETGYCVHFATAAAVLLQAYGIPARYVTGYVANVNAGEEAVVRLKNSHAWVEYWLPGFGWTVLEATPGGPGEPVAEETTESIESTFLQTRPHHTVETTKPVTIPDTSKAEEKGIWYWWVLGIGLVSLAVWLRRELQLYLRRKKCKTGTTNAQALARWQEVVYFARLLRTTADTELFDLAQKAKYSPYVITAEELARFDAYLQEATAALERRPLYCRVYDRWILAAY